MKHPGSRGIFIFLWLCPLAGILLIGCISFHGGDKLPSPDPLQAQIDALAARIATLEGQVQGLKAKLNYMSAEGTDIISERCNVHVRNGLATIRASAGDTSGQRPTCMTGRLAHISQTNNNGY